MESSKPRGPTKGSNALKPAKRLRPQKTAAVAIDESLGSAASNEGETTEDGRSTPRSPFAKKGPRMESQSKKLRAVAPAIGDSVPQADEAPTTAETKEGDQADATNAIPELSAAEYLATIQRRVKQTSKLGGGLVDLKLLASDPVYRIIHHTHRSDVVEVVKCKFGLAECERTAGYFEKEFSRAPVRRLRLQLHVPMVQGMDRLLPFFSLHRAALRLLDLSRNRLNADDMLTLCDVLQLRSNGPLEVLDLSYNRGIGNAGATQLVVQMRQNATLRALILKSVSVTDEGAVMMAPYVASRPFPESMAVASSSSTSLTAADNEDSCEAGDAGDGGGALSKRQLKKIAKEGPHKKPDSAAAGAMSTGYQFQSSGGKDNFFINLNENRIGAIGIKALRRDLPTHVSLTLVKQCVPVMKRQDSNFAPSSAPAN